MFFDIFKDIVTKNLTFIMKLIIAALACALVVVVFKSCTSTQAKTTIKEQQQTINKLIVNNQAETASAQNDRQARQESTERLVTHLDQQRKDDQTFKEIVAAIEPALIAPPPKAVPVKAAKPKQPSLTPMQKEKTPIIDEAERTQHNYAVLNDALQQAYHKAVQMSTPIETL